MPQLTRRKSKICTRSVPPRRFSACAVPTGSITVTAPLGAEYTYSIDGTTFQASPTFNGLAVKVYTITVRSSVAGSCDATASEEIKAASGGPTVTKTSVQPTCALPTGSITVTAPLGAEYTYSIDGTTFQASPTFSGLAPKVYTITVRSSVAGSCDATATEELKAATGGPTVTKSSIQPTCVIHLLLPNLISHYN